MKPVNQQTTLCFAIFVVIIPGALCACTWPSALSGTWYSSKNHNWTFDIANNYLQLDFATYGVQNFDCYDTDGARYVARIANITVFPAIPNYLFDIFLCLEFQQLSTNSFLYWRSNNVNPSLSNEMAFMRGIAYTTTVSEACEISKPYAVGTHNVMVKQGGAASEAVTCPSEFNANGYYYYDYNGVRNCGPSNSSLNACNSLTTFTFDYNACSDASIKMLYSNAGSLYCLYYVTDSGTTYLNLYNTDASPDDSTYYRFSCLVYAKSGTTILATQYPGSCAASQTTTVVTAPGEDLYFGVQSTCADQNLRSAIGRLNTATVHWWSSVQSGSLGQPRLADQSHNTTLK